ncbi:putative ATP-dependent RNA helicase [uncultured archaeon]|nr:putative ATP-dependent RNA helicase [uncultured archaeon]
MEQFEKLGLSKEVLVVLEEAGFKKPSEIQEKSIPLALAGKDIIGGSATGSGKTLVFASPIIENLKTDSGVQNRIQALILTPTRELAEQVAKSIKQFSKNRKLNILAVYGGVDIEQQIRRLRSTDVVVGTPGRILDHLKRRTIDLRNVKILVLDEVDRMFDMGFSHDVESILYQCPKERQTMMFSATISPDIDYLATKHTRNAVKISAESQVDPSKLRQIYYDVPTGNKFSLFAHLLKEETTGLVMVFCNTRRNVDFVADNLNRIGIHSQAIHGGLTQNNRTRVLEEFKKENIKVLVCTDVAGRGLDIKGVSHVYNYNIPKISTDYIHRIGRTARAGADGRVINLLSSEDYLLFGKIMEDDSLKKTIKEEPLPEFEFIRIRAEFKRDFSARRNFPRNFQRRDSRQRTYHKPRR